MQGTDSFPTHRPAVETENSGDRRWQLSQIPAAQAFGFRYKAGLKELPHSPSLCGSSSVSRCLRPRGALGRGCSPTWSSQATLMGLHARVLGSQGPGADRQWLRPNFQLLGGLPKASLKFFLEVGYIETNTFIKIIKSRQTEICCLRKWYVLLSSDVVEVNLPRMLQMGWKHQIMVATRNLRSSLTPRTALRNPLLSTELPRLPATGCGLSACPAPSSSPQTRQQAPRGQGLLCLFTCVPGTWN